MSRVALEHPWEEGLLRVRGGEEGHRGAQLERVDTAEDLLRRAAFDPQQRRRALAQSGAEDRVREVGPRLLERADRVALGHRAASESTFLREDEPHPVAALA